MFTLQFYLSAISSWILIEDEEDRFLPSLGSDHFFLISRGKLLFSALWLLLTPADHPYIKSLPTVEDLSTHLPVFWPDGFARQFPDWLDLRGDFDLADFATIVIHKIFHIWEDTDLPPITVEHVKWAISIVWTRLDHIPCKLMIYQPYYMIRNYFF